MRLSTLTLAILTLGYHANHALAEGAISGSTTDGHVTLAWEYDLEQGTGQLVLQNNDVPLWSHQYLYLIGLTPVDVTNLQFDETIVTLEHNEHRKRSLRGVLVWAGAAYAT